MQAQLKRILEHEIGGLVAGSAWIYGLRFGGAGLTFVTQLILARTIGADALGQYVLAFSTATVVGFVCTLGIPSAAMRFVPMDIETGRKEYGRGYLILARRVIVWASLGAWLAFSLLSIALFHDAAPATLWTHLFGAAMIPVCAGLIALTDIGRAFSLMTSTFAPNFIVRQAGLFIGIGVLILLGVTFDAAWVTGLTLATMIPLLLWQYRTISKHAERVLGHGAPAFETKRWVTASVPLVFVFGFTGFFLELNVTLAGQVLPAGELAAYNLAFQLVNLAGFALTAIDYKIGPELAGHIGAGRREAIDRLLRRATGLRTIAGVSIAIGLAIVGPWILTLFGPQFELAYTALVILALTQVVSGAVGPVGELHMFLGLERQGLVISIVSVVAAVVLTPSLVFLLGLEGAAISVLISTAIWELGLLAVIWRSGIQPSILCWFAPSPAAMPPSQARGRPL